MGFGPRRREAEGTGAHRFLGKEVHGLDVVGGCQLAPHSAFAHHIDPQRMMGHLGSDIDRARHLLERVQILRERLPVPLQTFGKDDAGDVLHPLHQIDEALAVLRPHRSETHSAVAEHDRRGTVPGGWGEFRIPHRLPIVVGMDVDPAGGHQKSAGIDLASSGSRLSADCCDPVAVYGEVSGKGWTAGTVYESASANNEVVHCPLPPIQPPIATLASRRPRGQFPCRTREDDRGLSPHVNLTHKPSW